MQQLPTASRGEVPVLCGLSEYYSSPLLPFLGLYSSSSSSQLLSKLRKASLKHVCVFIPSYFDFVRVRNFMKREGISFAQMCEYTRLPDISRARLNFCQGKRHLLLYTERLHFYRRCVKQ